MTRVSCLGIRMPRGGFKQITRGIGKEIDLHFTPYQSCDVIFGGREGGGLGLTPQKL